MEALKRHIKGIVLVLGALITTVNSSVAYSEYPDPYYNRCMITSVTWIQDHENDLSADDRLVSLCGRVIQELNGDSYVFQDSTGSIILDSDIRLPLGVPIVVQGNIDEAYLHIGPLEVDVTSWYGLNGSTLSVDVPVYPVVCPVAAYPAVPATYVAPAPIPVAYSGTLASYATAAPVTAAPATMTCVSPTTVPSGTMTTMTVSEPTYTVPLGNAAALTYTTSPGVYPSADPITYQRATVYPVYPVYPTAATTSTLTFTYPQVYPTAYTVYPVYQVR